MKGITRLEEIKNRLSPRMGRVVPRKHNVTRWRQADVTTFGVLALSSDWIITF